MKYRKLRIAWSVGWGVAAVLLIVLWMRSYWWDDWFYKTEMTGVTSLRICYGKLEAFRSRNTVIVPSGWRYQKTYGMHTAESFASFVLPGLRIHQRSAVIPVWLAAVFPAVTAGLPWYPQRFSLRALLIVTAMVAISLGLVVYWR